MLIESLRKIIFKKIALIKIMFLVQNILYSNQIDTYVISFLIF